MTQEFVQKLTQHGQAVTDRLSSIIAAQADLGAPQHLLEAMSYATLNGGKRLRPFLLIESAALFGRHDTGVLQAAAALECVHSYSLVHDDLPALDDDELRRGQKTTHIAFDEETAILVGDALQTLAFELVTQDIVHNDAAVRVRVLADLAQASGPGGMVGGQMLDLLAEGRHETQPPQQSEASIKKMQAMKTGALLRFACVAGAKLADATAGDIENMQRFGETIGLAFQLADDILDRTSNTEALGKGAGKDANAGKATLVDFMGLEAAKSHLDNQIQDAHRTLSSYGTNAGTLITAASFIANRTS